MRKLIFILLSSILTTLSAQDNWSAFDGINTQYEFQITSSKDKTPLWLNANRYGLSSLGETNGYIRATLERNISQDKGRRLGIGYGVDLALPHNHATNFAIQQLYAELRYKAFTYSIGSKCHPMEFKNQRLSTGSQTFGINARPIPQLRIAIDDYWSVPYTRGWISVKGHFSYGIMTDGNWQKEFTLEQSKFTKHALFHGKAGYMKVGREGRPFSVEGGLEMAAIFGGKIYWINEKKDELIVFKGNSDLAAFWHAFIPSGSDFREKEIGYENAEGNHVGSWLFRLNYNHKSFDISLYADRFFEDHSGLYNLGYYGYGKNGNWQERSHKLYLYPMKDALLGLEITLKNQNYLRGIVAEFINTRFQSGPIYHDHNESILDQIGGQDDFYNHYYYPSWQYYGQVIGNPLYLSPCYNEDGEITVKDNRFFAWHLGLEGNILPSISYRILASWQRGLGTYRHPYSVPRENTSVLTEFEYDMSRLIKGLSVRAAYGLDRGELLGNNNGVQITATYKL